MHVVSILVFLELAFGHPISLMWDLKARWFQSLFFWNSPSDVQASLPPIQRILFQSLFFWNSPSDTAFPCCWSPYSCVSILVFLELAFGLQNSASGICDLPIVSILVFLELAFGPFPANRDLHARQVSILVFLELAFGQRLFFVLFLVSLYQTGFFSPSSKHEPNLSEGL